MTNNKGVLYLIPTTIGPSNHLGVLPITIKQTIDSLDYFIVENEKSARKDIKKISPDKEQSSLNLSSIGKHSDHKEYEYYLDVFLKGVSVGLLSEAGVHAVADPGAEIVKIAHSKNIKVVPLVGPSSIILALMASGLNGQNFTFNGYLPIEKQDRKKELKSLEKISANEGKSQIFIETPYRNDKMLEDLKTFLQPNTMLCVACDITLDTEYIRTLSINDWKNEKPKLHKRPTIFIFQSS